MCLGGPFPLWSSPPPGTLRVVAHRTHQPSCPNDRVCGPPRRHKLGSIFPDLTLLHKRARGACRRGDTIACELTRRGRRDVTNFIFGLGHVPRRFGTVHTRAGPPGESDHRGLRPPLRPARVCRSRGRTRATERAHGPQSAHALVFFRPRRCSTGLGCRRLPRTSGLGARDLAAPRRAVPGRALA